MIAGSAGTFGEGAKEKGKRWLMVAAGHMAWPRVEKSRCGEEVDVGDGSMALLLPLEGCSEGWEAVGEGS